MGEDDGWLWPRSKWGWGVWSSPLYNSISFFLISSLSLSVQFINPTLHIFNFHHTSRLSPPIWFIPDKASFNFSSSGYSPNSCLCDCVWSWIEKASFFEFSFFELSFCKLLLFLVAGWIGFGSTWVWYVNSCSYLFHQHHPSTSQIKLRVLIVSKKPHEFSANSWGVCRFLLFCKVARFFYFISGHEILDVKWSDQPFWQDFQLIDCQDALIKPTAGSWFGLWLTYAEMSCFHFTFSWSRVSQRKGFAEVDEGIV